MPIATLAAHNAALETNGAEITMLNMASSTSIAGRPFDLWLSMLPAGVAPTTPVVPTRSTQGALGQQNGGANAKRILGAKLSTLNPGVYILADRLSHQGGLSGTTVGAQTTNLPTAALTRYTSGVGVMIGLTTLVALGATQTTVTVTYTNSDGVGGRVSPAVFIGSNGWRELNRMIMIPLQAGDQGVQSVQSVALTATTGTVGNFGVTLFKPLCAICVESTNGVVNANLFAGNFFGGLPEIVDDACIFPIAISSTSTNPMGNGLVIVQED
jgi:hypothetical protein